MLDTLAENVLLINGWVAGDRSAARAEAVPDHVDACRREAREIGALVWEAIDPEDLQDRLDASLDDARVRDVALDVTGAVLRGDLEDLRDFSAFVRGVVAGAGTDLVPDLLEGGRVLAFVSRLYQGQEAHRAVVLPALEALDLYSPAIPVPFLEAVLSGVRATLCFVALADVGLSKRLPPPWLAKLVVRTWIEEQRSFLRLPAMSRGAEVPEDVLPKHQRLDEAVVLREHAEGERLFADFIARATSRAP